MGAGGDEEEEVTGGSGAESGCGARRNACSPPAWGSGDTAGAARPVRPGDRSQAARR